MTPTLVAGVVGRLAAATGRAFISDVELMAVATKWADGLATFDWEDLELAVAGLLADPHAVAFPTLEELRRRTQLARVDRRRESGEGGGCVACVGSGGSVGWQNAGTDDHGREYVRECPRGCRPPLPSALAHPVKAGPQDALPLEDQRARFQAALADARQALAEKRVPARTAPASVRWADDAPPRHWQEPPPDLDDDPYGDF